MDLYLNLASNGFTQLFIQIKDVLPGGIYPVLIGSESHSVILPAAQTCTILEQELRPIVVKNAKPHRRQHAKAV